MIGLGSQIKIKNASVSRHDDSLSRGLISKSLIIIYPPVNVDADAYARKVTLLFAPLLTSFLRNNFTARRKLIFAARGPVGLDGE